MLAAPDILNASVLIVDDQESNISLIEQLLSETGYTNVTSTMFQSVQIKGLGHSAQLGADGGTVVQRGSVESATSHELSYRFTLQPGLQPGAYPWPLALSVRSL